MADYDQFDDSDVIGGLTYGQEFTPAPELISPDMTAGMNGGGLLGADWGYAPPEGYTNLADSGSASRVEYIEPEQPSMISGWIDGLKSLFGPAPDANGRQGQSMAASIVLGAAGSVLQSMAADKRIKADSDLENQRSSNRIKEKADEENRIRTAASAMPVMSQRGTRTVAKPSGLLSQAR